MASQPYRITPPEELHPDEFEALLQWAAASARLTRTKSPPAQGDTIMDFAQIGETAGAIWHALSKEGPLNMAALMEEVDAPQSVFFMAVGWLAREDKLEIEPSNGDYTVRLK
jgi:Winged helix-turn-helix domain (DUF2582)